MTHKPFIESEELLLLIEENVEDYALIVLDTRGRIINWNKGADRIFGYSLDEVWGEETTLIFAPEDRDHRVPQLELNTNVRNSLAKLVPLLVNISPTRSLKVQTTDLFLPLKQGTSFSLLVSELVSNAMKHGEDEVEVTLSHEAGMACLEVCDGGPGLPDGFDPMRAANTGLELIESLARHDLRGESVYQNRSTGGAQIRITFPVHAEPPPPLSPL